MNNRHRAITKIRRRRYSEVERSFIKISKALAGAGCTIEQFAKKRGYAYFDTKKKTITQLKKKNKRW